MTTKDIYIQESKPTLDLKTSYSGRTLIILGMMQLGCAVLAFGMEVAGISVDARPFSTGIWTGVLFTISGGLTIAGGKKGNMCLIVASLVMTIISCVGAGVLAIMSALVISTSKTYLDEIPFYEIPSSIIGIYTVLIITSLAMLLVTILTSIVLTRAACAACCCSCCCGSSSHPDFSEDLMTVESAMAHSKPL